MEVLDGLLGLTQIWHLHETKTTGLAAVFVFENRDGTDLSEGSKSLTEMVLGYLRR
jgi:hypothetical protein